MRRTSADPPLGEIQSVWEELNWRWWESLRAELRDLKLEIRALVLAMPELSSYAMAPDGKGGARAKLPLTFDLWDPVGPFQRDILPQLQRRAEATYWSYGARGGGSWAVLGPSWAVLGASRAVLEASLSNLGALLGRLGAALGALWPPSQLPRQPR